MTCIFHLKLWARSYDQNNDHMSQITIWFYYQNPRNRGQMASKLNMQYNVENMFSKVTTLFVKVLELELVCESYELVKL